MSRLYNRAFKIGFVISLFMFAGLNFYSAVRAFERLCFHCYETFGFPFAMYERGTIAHLDRFIWSGVVADVAVGIALSILAGGATSYLWRVIGERLSR